MTKYKTNMPEFKASLLTYETNMLSIFPGAPTPVYFQGWLVGVIYLIVGMESNWSVGWIVINFWVQTVGRSWTVN